jgi:transposase InsO family protein
LAPQKRGPKSKRHPQDEELQKLRRKNQRLTEELRNAAIVIDVQSTRSSALSQTGAAGHPTNCGVLTKQLGPARWTYFYLYVILDVFSRYVAGWMVAPPEGAELARQFIAQTIGKHRVPAGQLTIHADRGKVMTSKPVAFLMADLGVTKTHSRPYVSDENPYSESQFRTMKYRPEFPDRFGCIQDSHAFCQQFFHWYIQEHRHSGIGLLTPAMVHFGAAHAMLTRRQRYSMRPIKPTRTASFGDRPNPCRYPRRFGSTDRFPTKKTKEEDQ